jgi:hypothetical protein
MSLFPEGNGLNKNHDPGIWSTTPEFGSKPHLRSTVPNVQRHMAYFALSTNKQHSLVIVARRRWGDREDLCLLQTVAPVPPVVCAGLSAP